jgi:L-threonylcarbamoyladenylate synthase
MNDGDRKLHHERASDDDIQRAIRVLTDGGVVAIPTDTVYGLAASLEHPAAIDRVFSIKGRSGTKAIPILVSSHNMMNRLVKAPNQVAALLADRFWPGGLTIVVEANAAIHDAVLRGGTTVGLRMPDHPDALAIIDGMGGAVAVTSANRSGEIEARTSDEVIYKLCSRIDFVVEAGRTPGTEPSTVVDATRVPPAILREGAIKRHEIIGALEEVLR